MKTNYYIVGPPDPKSDDCLYWSNKTKNWVCFKKANKFNKNILHSSLPVGATGILEKNGKIIKFHCYQAMREGIWGGELKMNDIDLAAKLLKSLLLGPVKYLGFVCDINGKYVLCQSDMYIAIRFLNKVGIKVERIDAGGTPTWEITE